ncbi:uncharacterized protein PRCAT00004075001 [Priceomyces carsonii]|uniref:uncharacterized protein n=1 Tax=Priceomyces carsonii TaxID=28549 RepID=UPI002EDB681F|nr:unnamed protein product [Priceomyces carsonii]
MSIGQIDRDFTNAFGRRGRKDYDDLTIFSDNDSEVDIDSLINRSVEYGRSNIDYGQLGRSPRKFGLSPSKNSNNAYQRQVFKARNGSNSLFSSPTRNRVIDKENSSLNLDSFNDYGLDSDLWKQLDLKIKPAASETQSVFDLDALDDDDDDDDDNKTELLIRKTHRLINSVPSSISSSRENEHYLKLLRTSIDKLVKQLEATKKENAQLRNRKFESKNKVLESANKALARENEDLHDQNSQLRRKLEQRVPEENSQLLREKDLLRDKLAKYKKLFDEANEKLKSQTSVKSELHSPPEPGIPDSKDNSTKIKAVNLYNELAGLFNKESIPTVMTPQKSKMETATEVESKLDTTKQNNLTMLKLFEDLFEKVKDEEKDSSPKAKLANLHNARYTDSGKDIGKNQKKHSENSPFEISLDVERSEVPSSDNLTAENERERDSSNILGKILTTMDINNELYCKIVKLLETNSKTKSEPASASSDYNKNSISSAFIEHEALLKSTGSSRDHLGAENMNTDTTSSDARSPPASRDRDRDIILKCYMCCQDKNQNQCRHQHYHHNNKEYPGQNLHAKRSCKRCLSLASSVDSDAPKEKNDTVNLMGEYKWTI